MVVNDDLDDITGRSTVSLYYTKLVYLDARCIARIHSSSICVFSGYEVYRILYKTAPVGFVFSLE